MARLNISWRTANDVAPRAAATGDAEATDASRTLLRAEKPMLVFISDDDPTSSVMRKLEDVVFRSENVAIGAKFFDTVRVSAGDALQDRVLKEAGKGTPRLIFLTRDFQVDSVLQGKSISSGKVTKAMKRLASKEYVSSYEKMVRGYIKLLNQLDRLEGKKAQIADNRARVQAKPNASKEKKLEREEKKYQAELEEWQKAERELLAFQRKGEKKPEA